jgi:hypothetical protein
MGEELMDTTFDRLAAVTREAIDCLKAALDGHEIAEERRAAAIARAEAAEAALAAVTAERDALQRHNSTLESSEYVDFARKYHSLASNMNDIEELQTYIKRAGSFNTGLMAYVCFLRNDRDALQAKLDAGVRVYKGKTAGWWPGQDKFDTHTAIVIDPQPIADHIVAVNEMVPDPRTGPEDRRVNAHSLMLPGMSRSYDPAPQLDRTIEAARSNCRRRTPGTVADMKQWTRADGTTNERKGDRRKDGSWQYCACKGKEYHHCYGMSDFCWRTSGLTEIDMKAQDNRRDPSGANDRRKGKA